jgi:hypothetical protein
MAGTAPHSTARSRLDSLRDMVHNEENVRRRGAQLEAYYTQVR